MAELNDIVKSGRQPVERSALSDRNVSGVFSALPNHLKMILFFRHGRAQSRPSTLAVKEDVTKTHEEKAHENARRLGDPERQAPLNPVF